MMRILLINPPNSGKSLPEEKYGNTTMKAIFKGEPLALETIAAGVPDHDVEILDLKVEPDALAETLNRFAPHLVGVTGVTCEANAVLRIAGAAKKSTDAAVVAGGCHASCDPEYFNRPDVDYVVAGLGNLPFKALAEALDAGRPAAGVPGLARTAPGSKLAFPPRRFTEADLMDDRPPRYDLVEKYRETYVMGGIGARVGFVSTAFGCTHRCAFCVIPNLTGGKYLTRRVDAVMRDIELLGDIPLTRFVDANTFGLPGPSRALAERILSAGIKKRILADVRADTVIRHPDLFRLWRDAGLSAAVIGFEEIRDHRLEALNKKSSVADNIAAIRLLKEIGVKIIGDFIVSPDYAHEDFDRLEAFVAEHDIDLPMPSVLTPVPGTPLYEQLKDRIIVHDLDYYTFLNAVTPTVLPEEAFYGRYAGLLKIFHQHVN